MAGWKPTPSSVLLIAQASLLAAAELLPEQAARQLFASRSSEQLASIGPTGSTELQCTPSIQQAYWVDVLCLGMRPRIQQSRKCQPGRRASDLLRPKRCRPTAQSSPRTRQRGSRIAELHCRPGTRAGRRDSPRYRFFLGRSHSPFHSLAESGLSPSAGFAKLPPTSHTHQ